MKDINVDDVLDIMDDMRDVMDDQKEINEAMNRNYEIDILLKEKYENEELDEELEELDGQMRMEFDAKDLCVPNANKEKVVSKKVLDEKQLESMLR